MKKLLKVVLFLIIVIAISLGVLVFITYDSREIYNKDVLEDDRDLIEVVNNKLYGSFKEVNSSKKSDILFSETDLEYLVYGIMKEINLQVPQFEFTGVLFDVDSGKYTIYVSCSVCALYKTLAKVNIEFINENEEFVIKLNEVAIGKKGLTGVFKFLSSLLSSSDLEKGLKESGIYAKVNLDELTFKMSYDDIEKTLSSNMSKENNDLISLLFDIFLKDNNILKFNLGDDDYLGVKLDLSKTEYDSNIHGELTFTYLFDEICLKCESLLRNNIIDTKKLNSVFNFLVRGYDHIDDDTKNEINNIDLSSIGISNVKKYEGIIDRSDLSLAGYIGGLFKDKGPLELLPMLTGGLMVSDDFLNGIFQSLDFVGMGYAFNDYDNNVGYFVIESLALTCIDEKIKIDLIANINSYRLCIEIDALALDIYSDGLKIDCNIEKVLIGSIALTESEKYKLMKFLHEVLTSLDWISINEEKNEMKLDFSLVMASVISDNSTLNGVISGLVNFKTGVFIEDGYVSIKYSIF